MELFVIFLIALAVLWVAGVLDPLAPAPQPPPPPRSVEDLNEETARLKAEVENEMARAELQETRDFISTRRFK